MRKIILVFSTLIFVTGIFLHNAVWADTDDILLSIGVKAEYLDNIFFDSNDKVDDYITTLSPGIHMRKRTERLNAGLQGLFDAVLYVDNDELNNFDQFYKGYANYLVNERFSVGGIVSYKDDSRPDRDVAETGLILGTNVRRSQYYNGTLEYQLSELSDMSFRYRYRKEDYDGQQFGDDSHSAMARWKHDLGYWWVGTRSRVTFNYSRYNYEFTKTDNYSLTLGVEKELSELYTFYVDLGGRYSEYTFLNDDVLNINDDGAGGVLKSGLIYTGEYTYTNIYIGHDIAPASGRGRTLQRTSFVGSWRYRLTENLSSGLSGGYYWNRGDISSDPFDERTIRVAPRMIYQVANNMRVIASYSYTWIDRKNGDERNRNDFFINFTFNHSFFN